jgi:hypothetical protein
MSNGAIMYFDISKKASKVSKKVYDIESEYDDMKVECLFKVCSRCKKNKHLDHYGLNAYNGKPRKCCNQCIEYNKNYKLQNNNKS